MKVFVFCTSDHVRAEPTNCNLKLLLFLTSTLRTPGISLSLKGEKATHTRAKNFRPIGLSFFLLKTMERIIVAVMAGSLLRAGWYRKISVRHINGVPMGPTISIHVRYAPDGYMEI